MEFKKVFAIQVIYTLGMCVLQTETAKAIDPINVAIYDGAVGHFVSYNYPFSNRYQDIYTYRLYSSKPSPDTLCFKCHRFDVNSKSTFTIYAYNSAGGVDPFTYAGSGERVNNLLDYTLPINIWSPFCVNMYGNDALAIHFSPISNSPVWGFQFDYQADNNVTEAKMPGLAPCNSSEFTCYDRWCIDESSVCKGDLSSLCMDKSENTFAHAQCQDSDDSGQGGFPRQQPGFWACNFDSGSCSSDMIIGLGWVIVSSVNPPYSGPSMDHTNSGDSIVPGKFIHTEFISTRPQISISFSPGPLNGKEFCLSFWYYIDGDDPGTLTVEWEGKQRWHRAGSYGAKWHQGQLNLQCLTDTIRPCTDKVRFLADRASRLDSKISLDDVSVVPGFCPFTNGDLGSHGWTASTGCNMKDDWMSCFMNESHAVSPIISHGRCIVIEVKFFPNIPLSQSVQVFKRQSNQPDVKLATIEQQSLLNQEVRIASNFTIPAQIGFIFYPSNHDIELRTVHVVEEECENISPGACQNTDFHCPEGECISQDRVCDGKIDCNNRNGSDEQNCSGCREGGFLCHNKRCVKGRKKCNRVNDCGDNSDEEGCGLPTFVSVLIGIGVAICVSMVAVGLFLYKRCCARGRQEQQQRSPGRHSTTDLPLNADDRPPAFSHDYTQATAPPMNGPPPPAYGFVNN